MNTLHLSPNAYVDALTLPELQAELVLAASRMVGTRVVTSGLNAEFFVCHECAGRGRDRHQVQHLPDCVAGFVARLLLAVAHREAGQFTQPQRKEPSAKGKSQCEPARTAARESRPFVLPTLPRPNGWVWDAYNGPHGTPAEFSEPWELTAECEVVDAEGHTIVHPQGCTLPVEREEAALHRIVMCVNFCADVPTSALVREMAARLEGGGR